MLGRKGQQQDKNMCLEEQKRVMFKQVYLHRIFTYISNLVFVQGHDPHTKVLGSIDAFVIIHCERLGNRVLQKVRQVS